MTTLKQSRATMNGISDACADEIRDLSACPICGSLDPADHERLLNCAAKIRLREAGALDLITPWCGAGLPNDVLAKAKIGGTPSNKI